MTRNLLAATLLAQLTALGAPAAPPPIAPPDALDEALALVGLRRADLGWTPKAWWPRWPTAEYKLRAFDALFAAPLEVVTYTRSMGEFAHAKLDPAGLDQDNGRGGRPLFEAVQRLGIDPKFGGFRGYTANVLAPETPLDQAILALYRAAGRTTKPNTFGMELPYPQIEKQLAAEVAKLPDGVSPILGQLVLNIVEARRWVDLAFRKVDGNDRLTVATRLNTGEEMIDAYDYCPAFDDVARAWDEASMWYAAQQCTDALDLARVQLLAWQKTQPEALPYFAAEWETPWGWVIIHGGHEPAPSGYREVHDERATRWLERECVLLSVDLGNKNDHYYTGGAGTPQQPISLILDLGGRDFYDAQRGPAHGAGLCGVGIVLDAAGDDVYGGRRYAQGAGQFGFGLLVDLAGDDQYNLEHSGQGCGYFGVGLLFDVAGNDTYRIWCDGQGLGGVAGVGVLADRSGNDCYVAERKHSVTGRPSYHSPERDVGVSNVQGCGMGRRGDGADGHSWAGGLGALLDGGGDDVYTAGNWCMGTGYWFGIGVLHDRAGNDEYHGVAYSQGTGAHFCIGACIDEAGDDLHLAEENSHSSLAWAHDFTIGILLDVAGADRYRIEGAGLAYSLNRSVALVMDLAGDDVYETDFARREQEKIGLQPGYAFNPEGFRTRGVGTYFADTTSLGLYLDVGGEDRYWGRLGNNERWLDPPDSPNWADRNYSVGVDRVDGTVDFSPQPQRTPSAARGAQ